MSNITVSIVCTNYNKGDWIGEAIESFLRQKVNFKYEILVIDDASTDHSPDIIRKYVKKYPNKIRAYYNKENLGITKTWIKVCKEVKGKYIARCDGDDYWIDNKKLQKQVDLLKANSNSLWCSTDYDVVDDMGKIIHRSAFETGSVDRSKSYAEMLATKGFTMSSTWLVGADLMKEVNAEINVSAVDDTFNIQLDLFNKTKLTYLPENTTVFRLNEGSDSRPIEIDKIRSRHERLLKTQFEYIEKYKNTDSYEIIEILLHRSMQYEIWSIERMRIIEQLRTDVNDLKKIIENKDKQISKVTNFVGYRIGKSLVSKSVAIRMFLGMKDKS